LQGDVVCESFSGCERVRTGLQDSCSGLALQLVRVMSDVDLSLSLSLSLSLCVCVCDERSLCGGYNYDSTLIRRSFDDRSTKVIKVTVTWHTSARFSNHSHSDLFTYLGRSAYGHDECRSTVVAPSNCSRTAVESQSNLTIVSHKPTRVCGGGGLLH